MVTAGVEEDAEISEIAEVEDLVEVVDMAEMMVEGTEEDSEGEEVGTEVCVGKILSKLSNLSKKFTNCKY